MARSLEGWGGGREGCSAGGGGVDLDLGRTHPDLCATLAYRDAKERDAMKEESGTDVSVRSRKRKANVAVVSTKETGGGGDPLNLTWVPDWAPPHVY